MELLERVWIPAKLSADREREALEEFVRESGTKINIEPWDWRYYAEKVWSQILTLTPNLTVIQTLSLFQTPMLFGIPTLTII
jgi:Zn-dependent oligopeptidase